MTTIIVAILGFLGTGSGLWLMKWLKQRSANLGLSVPRDTFGAMNKIYSELNQAHNDLNARRALLLCGHNGGKVPHPGEPFKVTALYEIVGKDLKPLTEDWQSRTVDESYIKILNILEDQKIMIMNASEVGGVLADSYETNNIKCSLMIQIGWVDDKYYYMSFNFGRDKQLTAKIRDQARNMVISIRRMLMINKS